MAFDPSRCANNETKITVFGNYYNAVANTNSETIQSFPDKSILLHPEEVSFVREQATHSDADLVAACQERLNLGTEYYHAIRHQITSILELWDAIFAEKCRYDAVGWGAESRAFMDRFLTCSRIIPRRVNIGFLGPFLSAPGITPCPQTIPVTLSCAAPEQLRDASTKGQGEIVANPDEAIQGRTQQNLLDQDDYTEALALSPVFSDNTIRYEDDGTDVVSISSDGWSRDDSSRYSDQVQIQLELDNQEPQGNNSKISTTSNDNEIQGCWPSELLRDTELNQSYLDTWESFLIDNKPEGVLSRGEQAEIDDGRSDHQLVKLPSSEEAAQSHQAIPRKRKFVDDENDQEVFKARKQGNSLLDSLVSTLL